MYFGSKILISEREMTPSQHAQTQENRKKKFFFSIFCGQKLVGKIFLRPTPCVTVYRGGGGGGGYHPPPKANIGRKITQRPVPPHPMQTLQFYHQKKKNKTKQILNFIMFSKMCRIQRARSAVIASLSTIFAADMLVKNVATCVTQYGKESVVQQDKDKIVDLLVTMLKMIRAIEKMPQAEENTVFQNFLSSTIQTIPENIRERAVVKE